MGIKIELPKNKPINEDKELQIRRMIGEDFEKKEGLYAKCLVFIQMNEAVSVTELQNLLIEYFEKDFDRGNVFRACDKLTKFGVLKRVTSGSILAMSYEEKTQILNLIEAKHRRFLSKLPPHFRERYNDVNYFYVANGEGVKYLEWACKLLGFKYKEDKK